RGVDHVRGSSGVRRRGAMSEQAETEAEAGQTEARTVAEELLDQLQAAWMSRRRGSFREMCAPHAHWEDPVCREPLHGPEELADHAARLWEAFPDAKIETAGARLAGGRFAAAPVKLTGTHLGEIDGITPSQRYIVVHAVLYCELDPAGERLW